MRRWRVTRAVAGGLGAAGLVVWSPVWAGAVPVSPATSTSIPSFAPVPTGGEGQLFVPADPVYPQSVIDVVARGLEASTDYQVATCGDDARRGAADCDNAYSRTAVTAADGSWNINFTVTIPPVPCPCVVAAFPSNGNPPVLAPIVIRGATTGPPIALPSASNLRLVGVKLVGRRSWEEWFGRAPRRTVVVVVANEDSVTAPDFTLVMKAWNGSTSSTLVGGPSPPALGPYATGVYSFPVTFPALAHGTYHVVVSLEYLGAITSASTATVSFFPWGLVAAGALVLVIISIFITIAIRNRIEDSVLRSELEKAASEAAWQADHPVPVLSAAPDRPGRLTWYERDVNGTRTVSSSSDHGP